MPARKSIKSVARICLQKPLKVGPRRCTYRRWEAEVKGKTLITKTTELERMYRGNTPYPVGASTIRRWNFASPLVARRNLVASTARRKRAGYAIK
jgi:hypothetical protein